MAALPAIATDWKAWPLVAIACALAILVAVSLWHAVDSVQRVRGQILSDEIGRLRDVAIRREALIESHLVRLGSAEIAWNELPGEAWPETWQAALAPHQSYAAIVDPSGVIVRHTQRDRVGERLPHGWYDHRVPLAGNDVVRLSSGPLAGDAPALDVSRPVRVAGEVIGELHLGLDANWLDQHASRETRSALLMSLLGLAGILAVAGAAIAGMRFLYRQQKLLNRAIVASAEARSRELAQIGLGLAHEIRNPLHSMRINLHLLRRNLGGRAKLNESELAAMWQDCERGIERLSELMSDLLQFVKPHRGEPAELDLGREVQATLNMMAEEWRRDEIDVRARLMEGPTRVAFEPARLRQLVLNLLTFAQHKAGRQGTVEVEVARHNGAVELTVADRGQALSEEEQAHVFEPFQAPAETGSGLGLALVRVYAEEAGGGVVCQRHSPSGNQFRLTLPLVTSAS